MKQADFYNLPIQHWFKVGMISTFENPDPEHSTEVRHALALKMRPSHCTTGILLKGLGFRARGSDYIGILENKMETTIMTCCVRLGLCKKKSSGYGTALF